MNGPKKKLIEVGIIVAGGLFLLFKLSQGYIAKHTVGNEIQIEIPENFNLDEAKKALSNIGGIKDKAVAVEQHFRDILKKPDEVTKLEENTKYGVSTPEETSAEEAPLSLEGIMTGGASGNLAIISGKVVAEGDMVGNVKIVKIDPGRVVILKNGSQTELKR